MNRSVAIGVIALVAIAAIFQFFLRYNYVRTNGSEVLRVDRLTNVNCVMPCLPTPPPTPTPTPTPFDKNNAYYTVSSELTNRNTDAVELVRNSESASTVLAYADRAGKEWSARYDFVTSLFKSTKSDGWNANLSDAYKIMMKHPVLVCFCSDGGNGWYWAADLSKKQVHFVNDNADLSKEYGVGPKK